MFHENSVADYIENEGREREREKVSYGKYFYRFYCSTHFPLLKLLTSVNNFYANE